MSHGEGIVLLILAETPLGLSKGLICPTFLDHLPNLTDRLGGQWNEVLPMNADPLLCPTSANSGAYFTNRWKINIMVGVWHQYMLF